MEAENAANTSDVELIAHIKQEVLEIEDDDPPEEEPAEEEAAEEEPAEEEPAEEEPAEEELAEEEPVEEEADEEEYTEEDTVEDDPADEELDEEEPVNRSFKNDEYVPGDKTIANMKDGKMKKILQLKIPLGDGSRAPLFSRGPKYSDKCWPINCHLCFEGNLLTVKSVLNHLDSPMHQRKLSRRKKQPGQYMRAFYQPFVPGSECKTPLRIYPGEIIAEIYPQFQNRLITRNDFKRLSNRREGSIYDPLDEKMKSGTIVGLCYAMKMVAGTKFMYQCVLCRIEISNLSHNHFYSSRHVDKYLSTHFSKTMIRLKRIIDDLKLKYRGPFKDEGKHLQYIRIIMKRIYAEMEKKLGKREVKFTNTFNLKAKPAMKTLNSDHYNDKTITITDEELIAHTMAVFKYNPEEEKISKTNDDSTESLTTPSKTKPESQSKHKSRMDDNKNVLDRYSRMIGATLDDLEDTYDRFEKDPESHPRYAKEWKKYWHMRADELEKDGKDPHSYDFNTEWKAYWIKRLQELHAKDIVKHKFDIKNKLKLSYDARSPSPIRRKKRPRSSSPKRERKSYQRPRTETGRNRTPEKSHKTDERLSVISVLRLVTALEDQLGSLGPQAVQLLSRAILSSKNNSNPNDLLVENDFYVFFITAREKFKGQLLARIVEGRKIQAVNRTIDQITAIVDLFEKYRARNRNSERNVSHSNFPGNNGQNQYDGNNQYSGNSGTTSANQPSNQYSGGNQGGVWQSGAYVGDRDGFNVGNNQSGPSAMNYRRGNNRDNFGSVPPRNYQMGGNDDGNFNRDIPMSDNNRQFYCDPSGFGEMNGNNGNGQMGGYNQNSGMDGDGGFRRVFNNRTDPNGNGVSSYGNRRIGRPMGQSSRGGGPNRGGMRNAGDPNRSRGNRMGGPNQSYPMRSIMDVNTSNTVGGINGGYDLNRNSFNSASNRMGGGGMSMQQNWMGSGGLYNHR